MKNLKSVLAVVGMGLVIGLAGCEKKNEPGPRDNSAEKAAVQKDVKEIADTSKEEAASIEKEPVSEAAETAKKPGGGH